MEQAALEQGIPPDLARLLARQTVSGSGALLAASPEDAAALRIAVAVSPGGTTERALAVLMASDAWPAAVSRAIADATKRFPRELTELTVSVGDLPFEKVPAFPSTRYDDIAQRTPEFGASTVTFMVVTTGLTDQDAGLAPESDPRSTALSLK